VTKRTAARGKREAPADAVVRALGRRLRELREAAQLTQEDLGRAADLTAKFISQIENGHANPSIAVLARLVENGLSLPLAAFFSDASPGELRDDLAAVQALVGAQSPAARRRALRVLKALFAE